jgi:hypothetical protein
MGDSQFGKRLEEREHLDLFREAYELATGEALPHMEDSETPDFIGNDAQGCVLGIEVTKFRFEQDERVLRRAFAPGPGDFGACCRLLKLMHKKALTLAGGRWRDCERKILVVIMIDVSIADIASGGAETDRPETGGFDEVWLVDSTQVDAFGAADLFALVHPTREGHFATGDRGQKPYG